jgi:hypothetical protein
MATKRVGKKFERRALNRAQEFRRREREKEAAMR